MRRWVLFAAAALAAVTARAADTVCANVKIEVSQRLTLERQAFDAHMRIHNGFSTLTLSRLGVTVLFTDADHQPVLATTDPNDLSASFFIRVDRLENIGDVNGTGVVAPNTTADAHWLIIPAPGAARGRPLGALYFVGAELRYNLGGEDKVMTVTPDFITVKPMPELALDYFLPRDVLGDDPFTADVESPVPFPLGVRVKNNGWGPAQNLKIESAQPKIVDNAHGLLVGFEIGGCDVNGVPAPSELLADFGNLAAGAAGVARWNMTATLSGRFTEFYARFTHADVLGGQLTSLLQSVNTHTLIRDVRLDLPGRDIAPDFLADDGGALKLYYSEGADQPVTNLSASAALSAIPGGHSLTLPSAATYVYARVDDPAAGGKPLRQVVRSDGKVMDPANVWLSRRRVAADPWTYSLNIFDTAGGYAYDVLFDDPGSIRRPPAFDPIPASAVLEGRLLAVDIRAVDPQGDTVSLSASALPVGATFVDHGNGTGRMSWTPAGGQAGLYEAVFRASNGDLTATGRAVITVNVPGGDLALTTHPAWISYSTPAWSWTADPSALGYWIRLDAGEPVFTTHTDHNAPTLADGPHTFAVTAQFDGTPPVYGRTAHDTFGVDTRAPVILSLRLGGGAPAVATTTVTVELTDDADGNGSGVALIEASVDGGVFAPLTNGRVTIADRYGVHTVAVRATDALGHVSDVRTASILYAPGLQRLSGRSTAGVTAELHDLRGPTVRTALVTDGRFVFDDVPTGAYGLLVRGATNARAHGDRLVLTGGDVDAGAVEPSVSSGAVAGTLTPPLAGVPVSARANLGRGASIELARTATDADGRFVVPSLAPGRVWVRADPTPESGWAWASETAVVTAGSTTACDLVLSSATRVAGSGSEPDARLSAVSVGGRVTPFRLDPSGAFAIGLPAGPHLLFGRANRWLLDPFRVDVTPELGPLSLPIRTDFPGTPVDVSQASAWLPGLAEAGITTSLQWMSFRAPSATEGVAAAVPASDEWRDAALSSIARDDVDAALCLLTDDPSLDMHSAAVGPFTTSSTAAVPSGAGARLSGVVRDGDDRPLPKAMVELRSSDGNVLGSAESGVDGSFLFKAVRPDGSARLRAVDPRTGEWGEGDAFALAHGERRTADVWVGRRARVAISDHPIQWYAGQTLPVDVAWSGLGAAAHRLTLTLKDPTGTVAAVNTDDVGTSSGTRTRYLTASLAAAPGSGGWIEARLSVMDGDRTAAEGRSPADILFRRDVVPPFLTLPADVTAEALASSGTAVALAATATDDVDPSPRVTSDAPALFPLGRTPVTFRAVDFAGNASTGTATVTIRDTTPPLLASPPDVSAEATARLTPLTLDPPPVIDLFPATVTHDAPASFALGLTSVTWTARDMNGNVASARQNVTIRDTTPPVVTPPADRFAEAQGERTRVALGTATASDLFPFTLTNDATADFGLGVTTVTWSARDDSDNVGVARQRVTVRDTRAPTLTLPPPVTVEAAALRTTVVLGTATARDLFPVTVTNNAPTDFPLGTTYVTWTARDANGNARVARQRVTVRDTTPPTLSAPPDATVAATGALTPVALGTATASDIFPVTVTNNAPTTGFRVGVTTVRWTATDTSGNRTQALQRVTVTAPPAPTIRILRKTGDSAGLRNGEYWSDRPVAITYSLQAPAGSSVTVNVGQLNAASATVTIPANGALGDSVVMITARDVFGRTATARTLLRTVLRVPTGNFRVSPNPFRLSSAQFTVTLALPGGYAANSLSGVTCDGAPARRVSYAFNRATLLFSTSSLARPVDTAFTVRGTFRHNNRPVVFQGDAKVLKVIP